MPTIIKASNMQHLQHVLLPHSITPVTISRLEKEFKEDPERHGCCVQPREIYLSSGGRKTTMTEYKP